MKLRMLLGLALFLLVAAPAQAKSNGFKGVVIAKQPQRGTLVLAGARGAGLTVHVATTQAKLGDRVSLQGLRLRDGTIRATRLRVVSHTRQAMIRGVVVRQLSRSILVATGRSVITIHHAAGRRVASTSDDGGLTVGSIADFRLRIDDDDVLEEMALVPVGQTANVRIEGTIVTVTPLVVSLEGLPITITVPAGMTLPTTLAIGQRIELTVTPAAGNVFTLVSIDEIENVNPVAAEQEVEVNGSVVGSTTTQIMVSSGGTTFTFAAPAGVTLPVLPVGTMVEVRGVTVNGVLTLERLKVGDQNDDNGGPGNGGDDGGGDHGGGGGGDHGGGGDDGGGGH